MIDFVDNFCSELEESLLVLPFEYVMDLLKLIDRWMRVSLQTDLFYLLVVNRNIEWNNQLLCH